MKAITYARSHSQDEINRQAKTCRNYTEDALGTDVAAECADNPDTYPATIQDIIESGAKSDDNLTHVITPRVKTLADSWRDCVELIEEFVAGDVEVHAVEDGVYVRDENDVELLRFTATAERENAKDRAVVPRAFREGKHKGRPPLGFTTDGEGRLRPATEDDDRTDTFEKASRTLREVVDGDTSIRTAANRLNCSRTTIKTAIRERPEWYDGLDEDAAIPSNPRR